MAMQRTNPITIFRLVALLFLGFLLVTPAAHAQQVRAYVSADSVRVGDRFSLTVVAEHAFVEDPIFPESQAGAEFFGDLEVLAIQQAGSRLASDGVAGSRIDSLVYEVATFALDTAYVPSIPVFFVVDADTSFYASYPIEIPVISLVPEDAAGIRDLAPIADFPVNPWPWILGILALLGVIAGLYYLWKRRRESLPQTVIQAPVPKISPIEEAIKRLRTLEKEADLQDLKQIKPFYVELTEILRVYMSRRLRINAMESTSHELIHDLNRLAGGKRITPETVHLSKRVLHVADLVKFADIQPAPEVGHQAFRETRKILDEVEAALRPVEKPPAAEAEPKPDAPQQPAEESAHEQVDPV